MHWLFRQLRKARWLWDTGKAGFHCDGLHVTIIAKEWVVFCSKGPKQCTVLHVSPVTSIHPILWSSLFTHGRRSCTRILALTFQGPRVTSQWWPPQCWQWHLDEVQPCSWSLLDLCTVMAELMWVQDMAWSLGLQPLEPRTLALISCYCQEPSKCHLPAFSNWFVLYLQNLYQRWRRKQMSTSIEQGGKGRTKCPFNAENPVSSSIPLLQTNFSPPTQSSESWAACGPASHQAPLLCYPRRPELLLSTLTTYHRWINKSRKTLSWCRAKPPDEWEYSLGWAQAECDWWVQPPDYSHKYISISFEEKSIPCSCCNSRVVSGSWQRPFWELSAQREMQKWLPASPHIASDTL